MGGGVSASVRVSVSAGLSVSVRLECGCECEWKCEYFLYSRNNQSVDDRDEPLSQVGY